MIERMREVSERIDNLIRDARVADECCEPDIEDVLRVVQGLAEVVRDIVAEMSE